VGGASTAPTTSAVTLSDTGIVLATANGASEITYDDTGVFSLDNTQIKTNNMKNIFNDNPLSDGQVLSSDTVGNLLWVDNAAGSKLLWASSGILGSSAPTLSLTVFGPLSPASIPCPVGSKLIFMVTCYVIVSISSGDNSVLVGLAVTPGGPGVATASTYIATTNPAISFVIPYTTTGTETEYSIALNTTGPTVLESNGTCWNSIQIWQQ
jgi:hypothetical protein